jgi:acetyl esterase/lipase
MAVAGNSVGGNMATAVAMLAKERHGPKNSLSGPFLSGYRSKF